MDRLLRRSKQLLRPVAALLLAFAMLAAVMPSVSQAAPAARAQESYGKHYTVRPGDSLSKIAWHYGVSVEALMQANGIYNANHIWVGQVLVIPGSGPSSSCARTHYVVYGQTLSHIALYYGVSQRALMYANNIYNANHVYAGQTLCIPSVGGPAPAPPSYGGPSFGGRYTVTVGDTLSGIAYYFGTTVYALMQANGIANANHIYVGQVLAVPAISYPAPAPAPAPAPHPAPAPQPAPVPTPVWTGLYYNNTNFSGTPVLVRQDAAVNFDWGLGGPITSGFQDYFSAIWTSNAYFSGGTYRFNALSDDGVRVYVDGAKVIDGWGVHPASGYFADVQLSAGYHSVRVEYFEQTEYAVVKVNWTRY